MQKSVSYTATMTSKGQMTVPKEIRKKLSVKVGEKFEVMYTPGGFMAKQKTRPKLLELGGIFKDADDGRPWEEVIEEAKRNAAIEIAGRK